MRLAVGLAFAMAAFATQATTYQLVPLTLDNGTTVRGTIDTDGTVGYLTPLNIVSWDITVTQTTDVVYTDTAYAPTPTEATTVVVTPPPEVSGVSSNGKRILVQRSPDTANYADGGSLLFRAAGNAEPTWAAVADFSSYTSWWYPDSVIGGVGGWVTASGLSLGAPLTQAPCRTNGSCSNYAAATAVNGQPNTFRLVRVTTQAVAPVQTLFGTITTDGTVGSLAPGNFLAWHIVGRTQEIQSYNPTNSIIRNLAGTYADNTVLRADNFPNRNPGVLDIGTAPNVNNPGISVNLADFTDPMYLGGIASYSNGNFGLVASKSPLTTRKSYVVARVIKTGP
jgi:hypothetical protein